MFKPLQANAQSRSVSQTSYMAKSGQNQRDLPQLLDTTYAQIIRNYFPAGVGRLESREGITKIMEVAGVYSAEMAHEFTQDIWIFGYNNTVAAYEVSTGTVTNIKTDFTATGSFEGQRAGDYFFVVNGVEKPFRITRNISYTSRTALFTAGKKLTGATSGATAVVLEASLSLTGGTSAESTVATWAAVTNGSFRVTLDGVAYNVDGIDFSSVTTMAEVASTIQSALRTASSTQATVVWSTDHFVITSSNNTASSSVSALSTSTGTVGTDISGAGAGDFMDADTGTGVTTSGFLVLGEISGTFVSGEIITDEDDPIGSAGSATSSSAVFWAAAEVSTAPIAGGIKLIGTRLFLFRLLTNNASIAYSNVDTGANPPYSSWTVATGANDAGKITNRTIGNIRGIELLGSYYIAWGDNGKFAFSIDQIDSGGTIVKVDNFLMHRIDFGSSRGILMTPIGLVYANENGIYSLLSVGADNQEFSDQEYFVSELLGNKYFDNVDMSDCDIVFDEKRKNILVTCRKNSSSNNLIIGYNIESKALFEITGYGWNISRFFKSNGEIYAASSTATKIYKLFDGYTDDGQAIGTKYIQEITLNNFWAKNDILGCYTQGFLSQSSQITVHFDIYNTRGVASGGRASYLWTPQYSNTSPDGWSESAFSENSWGGYDASPGLIECFDGCRPRVRRAQRVILRITAGDMVPHKISWVTLQGKLKAPIRRRKMAIQ